MPYMHDSLALYDVPKVGSCSHDSSAKQLAHRQDVSQYLSALWTLCSIDDSLPAVLHPRHCNGLVSQHMQRLFLNAHGRCRCQEEREGEGPKSKGQGPSPQQVRACVTRPSAFVLHTFPIPAPSCNRMSPILSVLRTQAAVNEAAPCRADEQGLP